MDLSAELHRMANCFQILSALLSFRRRHLTDPAAREQIEWVEQIVDTLMLQAPRPPTGDHCDLAECLEHQLAPWRTICTQYKVDLVWRTQKVVVLSELQITVALIVNELVTNAVKHAFRDTDGGKIEVTLRRVDKQVELAVADNGAGPPAARWQTGTGLPLLESMTARLGGNFKIERDKGTTVRVRFPISDAANPPGPPPSKHAG